MGNYFSEKGLEYYSQALLDLKKKATDSGKNVGAEAGLNCDWHDNFGFDDAKRQFERDSQRVGELEASLGNPELIVIVEQNVRVAVGNTVELEIMDDSLDELVEKTVTIGAWGESSPKVGLISYEAPVAKAILGKECDDEGSMVIQERRQIITILEIFPPAHLYRKLIDDLFESLNK